MTARKIVLLALAILLPLTVNAQKKKKRIVKKPVVEEPQEDPRITNMREMTQQIIIIDSIVADKSQVLAHLRLSSEAGRLLRIQDVFKNRQTDSTSVYINELSNKLYYSTPDSLQRQQLVTCDKLAGEWSQPQRLLGLNDGISEAAYPFMLTDGITFYFAGKGEESIGGYDIFMTRYDSHSGSFLRPENLGMPFNSEANDYLYAVDEFNRIGYFVSDRRQPAGKVCIYVFIPSESRRTYDSARYTEQQLRSLAAIKRIADTWGNGSERKAALARWKQIGPKTTRAKDKAKSETAVSEIIINDALTYSSADDFHSAEAARLYRQVLTDRQRLEKLKRELATAREKYAQGNKLLKNQILRGENEETLLNYRIQKYEKQIRYEEINVIN